MEISGLAEYEGVKEWGKKGVFSILEEREIKGKKNYFSI